MTNCIRPATAQDADRIGAILSDWIDETPWMPRLHTRAEDRDFCAGLIQSAHVDVMEKDGVCAGFVALSEDEISALYVSRTFRRKGVGGGFLAKAKQRAQRLTLWTFQANRAARAFYAAHGFREVEITDGSGNEERLPDVRCEWRRVS